MNYVADELNDILDNSLSHYGVKRRSGRYPWGSGDSPYQHSGDFLSRVEQLKAEGKSRKEICEELGISSTKDFELYTSYAKHERKADLYATAKRMREKEGMTNQEIADALGLKGESSVRSLLNFRGDKGWKEAHATADILRKALDSNKMIDIGEGVERELGISKNKLEEAAFILEQEGYNIYGVGIPQATNKGKNTTITVLAKPDVEYGYVYKHPEDIMPVKDYYSEDGGKTYKSTKMQYPASVDMKRVGIRYAEEGGIDQDGVIEIRPGVADLDLGGSHYAQVRILVDGTHYLKGMARYSDDIPDGMDIMFNTNKTKGTDPKKVLKEIKEDDPENPFGAAISAKGQSTYIGKDGKEHLSAINKLKEEGEWDDGHNRISSQFLSKQPIKIIKQQLNDTYKDKEDQFDEIMTLTNPTIKRKMLMEFAGKCDSSAVDLQAKAFAGQTTKVILPLTKIKDTEVYAPTYANGTQIALVRFPHGGTFEIPVLTVNNKNEQGKSWLKNAKDAIGINHNVADRLSGADFDGDFVVAIPITERSKIKSTPALKGLQGFDPKTAYSTEGKTGVRLMKKDEVQKQMGMISNLVTDMTLKGANENEITRAVRHSMVVIDACKHKLDYKQSEKDNGIAELKQKYQLKDDASGSGGASTLLSRRNQTIRVDERKGSAQIDPKTGEVSYKTSGRTYVDKKTGKTVKAQTEVKLLAETKDLHTLSSGTKEEEAYADYGNKMKALANRARKEAVATGNLKYNPAAAKTYAKEVADLKAKTNEAMKNAPRERRAQVIANADIRAFKENNPDAKNDKIKKYSNIAINDARTKVGAGSKDLKIVITDKEWEAIQAGAISDNQLSTILRYTNTESLYSKALPKTTTTITPAKEARIKTLARNGATLAEISAATGVSVSTVSNYIN